MAHGTRSLLLWNKWLEDAFLGKQLLNEEIQLVSTLLNNHFGKHVLLMGVPQQFLLLDAVNIPHRTFVAPHLNNLISSQEINHNINYLDADFYELPIASGTVDLVLLPHTLEWIDNSRKLLTEACRVIKPGGLIVIFIFNPYSMWAMKKILHRQGLISPPYFTKINHLKNWLSLADFELEQNIAYLFRPPIPSIYEKLKIFDMIAKKFLPFLGGGYILIARAKVVPLTPIRLKWRQRLSGIGLTSIISGPIAR